MPDRWSGHKNVMDWPVKVLIGTFSESKKLALTGRYRRRQIRVEFRRPA